MALAASSTLNALFISGNILGTLNTVQNQGKTSVILRLDLEQRTYRWRRAFDCISCNLEISTAIAVNPAGTLVVIYGTEFNNYDYERESYILLVDAVSGHYVTDILEIDHR